MAKVNPAARWEADLQDQLASAFAKRDAWLEANGPVEEVIITENEDGERLYDYTNERETGDEHNLYWNNHTQQLTRAELEEKFNSEGNGQLREAFGDFDNYMAYMDERQDLIASGELKADWWDTGRPLVNGETGNMGDRELEQSIINQGVEYGQEGYNSQAEIQEALYQKYTGAEGNVWNNSDGDTFRWNGTSFVKTGKVDDHNYGAMVPGLVVGGVLGAGLGPALANWGLTGTLNAAASGALGNAVSQGMLTGSIDPKEVLYSGLTSGALSGFADYLSDSANMFPSSDLGGMLGDNGFLNQLGFDTDYLSTSAGISALDWAANNPIINGAQQLLAPILNSELGQGGLDLLTSALMGGYNDDWREHYDPETGALDLNATPEDFENFNRFKSAIKVGESALSTGQSLDGSPLWNLDERYFWTTTPRDPNSTLVGILEQPLESAGGMEAYIAFLNAANEADKDSNETGEGEEVSGSGSSTGDGDGEGLEGEGDKGEGDGMLSDLTSGGSGTIGNASGSGAGMDTGGSLPVTGNGDQAFINQLLEAIANETDPDVKAALQQELVTYLSSVTNNGSDGTLGNEGDDGTVINNGGGNGGDGPDDPIDRGNGSYGGGTTTGDEVIGDKGPLITDVVLGLLGNTQDQVTPGNPTTLPPADDPTTLPPADDPTTLPPADDPTTLPPADDPTTLPPADDPTTLPPADDPTTIPPADTNVLPPGDSGGGGATPGLLGLAGGGDGLPPIWTDLDPYTTIKRYKSQRTKLLDGMLASLNQQNAVAPASFIPKSPSEKELFEAGMFS